MLRFLGWNTINSHHERLYELMQFRVTLPVSGKGKFFSMPPPINFPILDAGHIRSPRGISCFPSGWIVKERSLE